MTIEIEDAALARFLEGPAPHGSGEPSGFTTAREELAAALEGQAPRLSRLVFDRLGPAHTAELAQVVRRAVAVGIRRRADLEVRESLAGAYELLVAGLDQVTDGCTTPEAEADPEPEQPPISWCRIFGVGLPCASLCTDCATTYRAGREAHRG